MDEPGGLSDLGAAGRAAWDDAVARCLAAAVPVGGHALVLPRPDARTPHVTGPDWTGLPPRVVACLGRSQALRVLDAERRLQEEYLEWRTVRGPDGRIRRVELTTELRDLWRVLAAHEPARTLELVGELSGRAVRAADVYGIRDPAAVAPEERAQAFSATTIARRNPLNDGRRGICFMTHPSNDLGSLATLVAAATTACTARDGRCASADEVVPLLGGAAVAGRASDPVIVERLGRLAFERRLVALDDPAGVWIDGIEHTRLRTPDGAIVPPAWFARGRGVSAAEAPDGRARHQRVVLEVPAGEGFAVSDLVDAATEQPIRSGAQVAELVALRVLVRTSDAGVAAASAPATARRRGRRPDPCGDVRAIAARPGRR